MDLGSLSVLDPGGSVIELRHPVDNTPLKDDDGSPVTITVLGTDSDAFRTVNRQLANAKLAKGRKFTPTVEEFEADAVDVLAACTLGWKGIELDGKVLTFSRENARKLYSDRRIPWLREQVDQFIADRANFVKPSSTT